MLTNVEGYNFESFGAIFVGGHVMTGYRGVKSINICGVGALVPPSLCPET